MLGERPERIPRGRADSRSRFANTRTAKWRRRCSVTSARSPRPSSSRGPSAASRRHVVGQEGLEYYYDRYLRGEPGVERVEVNAEGDPVPARSPRPRRRPATALQLTLDLGSRRRPKRRCWRGSTTRGRAANRRSRRVRRRSTPATAKCSQWARIRRFDPNRFVKPLTQHEYEQLEAAARPPGPLTTGRSTAPIRPARPSSRSPRWRR